MDVYNLFHFDKFKDFPKILTSSLKNSFNGSINFNFIFLEDRLHYDEILF